MGNLAGTFKKILLMLFKIIVAIIIWIMLNFEIYPLLRPHITTINPNEFMVCVIDKDHRLRSDGSHDDISYPMLSSVTDQPPCDKPTPTDEEIFYQLDWLLEQTGEDEWEVGFYMGYWDDPHIYHYRVENGKIIPMWHAKSLDLGYLFWTMIVSLVLTLCIFMLKNKCLDFLKFKYRKLDAAQEGS